MKSTLGLKTKSRPRVLMLTTQLGYGGSESSFLRLANYLSSHLPVTIALFTSDYGSTDYSNAQSGSDLPVVLLDQEHDPSSLILGKFVRWWRRLKRLRELKRRHDVTISFLSGPNLLNALAGKQFASIVSERGSKVHHVDIPLLRKTLWTRILDPLIYRMADKIVPASHGYAEEIQQLAHPAHAWKIVPIEGGISADALLEKTDAEIEQKIATFCLAPTVVFCGRLDRGKGIDFLIPVFARAKKKVPESQLLVLGDGPLLTTLVKSAKSHGLRVTHKANPKADVFFAGYQPEPMRYFRFCRAFAFPSQHEGLGNALIEAVAAGIPILAADCNFGPRSILANSAERAQKIDPKSLPINMAYGTLMPVIETQGSSEVWSTYLLDVLTSSQKRTSLENRRAAVARFDIENTGKSWLQIIEELTGKSGYSGTNSPSL